MINTLIDNFSQSDTVPDTVPDLDQLLLIFTSLITRVANKLESRSFDNSIAIETFSKKIFHDLSLDLFPSYLPSKLPEKRDGFNYRIDSVEQILKTLLRESLVLNTLYESSFRISNQANSANLQSLKTKQRDKDGVFYTPIHIVDKILSLTVLSVLKSQSFKRNQLTILDPACGGGIFLTQSSHHLLQKDLGLPVEKIIAFHYGVDKDRLAVLISRLSLFIEGFSHSGNPEKLVNCLVKNILFGNSLISKKDLKGLASQGTHLDFFDWNNSFSKVMKDGGFQIVLGNPPYGISRDEKISKIELDILKNKFSKTISGKPNKYMLFLSLGISLTRHDGLCGMIVPNSWLGIKSGELLRKKIIEEKILKKLLLFEDRVFQDPSLEAVIVIIEKDTEKNKEQSEFILERYKNGQDLEPKERTTIPLTACTRSRSFLIPTKWSIKIERLISDIFNSSILMGNNSSPFIPRIALQAYAKGKGSPPQSLKDIRERIYDEAPKKSEDAVPYLDGESVGRFSLSWNQKYLRHGPFLADPQPLERFITPRVLLREIIKPLPNVLLATYTDQPFLYNKSILHILPKDPLLDPNALIALTGILNSPLGSFIILYTGRKSQRKIFPKIVNDDLKDFPIPVDFLKNMDAVTSVTMKLFDTTSPNVIDEHLTAEQELLRVVSDIYKLSSNSRSFLNEFLGPSSKSFEMTLGGV